MTSSQFKGTPEERMEEMAEDYASVTFGDISIEEFMEYWGFESKETLEDFIDENLWILEKAEDRDPEDSPESVDKSLKHSSEIGPKETVEAPRKKIADMSKGEMEAYRAHIKELFGEDIDLQKVNPNLYNKLWPTDDGMLSGPMNLSGTKIKKENSTTANITKPMSKEHLKNKEVVINVGDGIPQRGPDNSFLTEDQSKKLNSPMNFNNVQVNDDDDDFESRFKDDDKKPMNFKDAAEKKDKGGLRIDIVKGPTKENEIESIDDIESIDESEYNPPENRRVEPAQEEKEEKPGWHKQEGTNFWTVNSKSPYWKTEKGGKEAEKLWGSRPSWVKQRN